MTYQDSKQAPHQSTGLAGTCPREACLHGCPGTAAAMPGGGRGRGQAQKVLAATLLHGAKQRL